MASRLEELAKQAREELIKKNNFNHQSDDNKYSAGHTRAVSDQKTPNRGKGTNNFLDTENGGNDFDINGNPNKAGSGRAGNVGFNFYDKDLKYSHPDTSNNEGQISI